MRENNKIKADDGRAAKRREEMLDSELAYETLAVDSAMGMYGMNEETANLMQLELTSQMMYKFSLYNDKD